MESEYKKYLKIIGVEPFFRILELAMCVKKLLEAYTMIQTGEIRAKSNIFLLGSLKRRKNKQFIESSFFP